MTAPKPRPQPSRTEIQAQQLRWALEASGESAWFLVFQDNLHTVGWPVDVCRPLGAVRVVSDPISHILEERMLEGPAGSTIEVLPGVLSSVPRSERARINASRDRILALKHKLVFVEPAGKAQELYADFPDVFSCVRDVFRIETPVFADDDLFDSSSACRLENVARKIPSVITRGATIISGGKVHSKAPIAIPCPKCGQTMVRGTTTLTFHHAPEATRDQIVQGWICACGEAYVPGPEARAAHARAFGNQPSDSK